MRVTRYFLLNKWIVTLVSYTKIACLNVYYQILNVCPIIQNFLVIYTKCYHILSLLTVVLLIPKPYSYFKSIKSEIHKNESTDPSFFFLIKHIIKTLIIKTIYFDIFNEEKGRNNSKFFELHSLKRSH